MTDLRWAQPWRYDARYYVTHPELVPVFVEPPPTGWQDVDDEADESMGEAA